MFTNRTNRSNTAAKLLAGFKKHCAESDGMVVEGQKRSTADIISILQELIDAHEAVAPARAALHGAILGEQQKEGETAFMVNAVRQSALIMFGSQPEVLADFGIAPRKIKRAQTVGEKLGAVAKALETRKARHTMGRRQREAIRGNAPVAASHPAAAPPAPVVAPVVTPVVTPPSPIHLNGTSAPTANGAPQNGGG